uniref:Uncharacterized protein n=1 Tax=Physcomitrium patens TaxID=3218 RepID=A0A7I4AQ28_PHYPA
MGALQAQLTLDRSAILALGLIKFVAGKAGKEFRRKIQRQAAAVRQLLHYKLKIVSPCKSNNMLSVVLDWSIYNYSFGEHSNCRLRKSNEKVLHDLRSLSASREVLHHL